MPSLLWPRKLPVQTAPLSQTSWDHLHEADRFIDDVDRVLKASVKEMRKIINQVPWAQRGHDWTERVVLIYVVKGEQLSRCKVLIKKMEAARLAKGDAEATQAFKARLKQMIDIHVIARRGFNFSFAYSDKERVARELKRVTDEITAMGYDVFLDSGTLLGAVRGKTFISHDNDVDLAVVLKGNNNTEVLKSFYDLYDAVKKIDGLTLQYRSKKKRPVFKIKISSGARIDLFPAYVVDGMFYVWPHTFGEIPVGDVLPLGEQELHGINFPAPNSPEKMLELNYGPNWRVPDPTFKFPWAEAEAKFAPLIAEYRHNRRWDLLRGFFMPWTK